MRASLVAVVALSTIVAPILSVRADEIPTLNIEPLCRGIVSQGSDPAGGSEPKLAFRNCMDTEKAEREKLKKEWSKFSSEDKRHCVAVSTTDGGESSYSELITCLEMSRDVKKLTSRSPSIRRYSDGRSGSAARSEPRRGRSTLTVADDAIDARCCGTCRRLRPPACLSGNHVSANTVTEPRAEAATPLRPAAFPIIACSGPFALDSGNLSLAVAFDSKNVVFAEVDGGPIGKVPASVVFPNDPKRRLEVWWSDPASRTRVYPS